jgi:hypothetical protein
VGQVFNQNLEQYLDGAITFDDILFFMEEEASFSIQEGQDRIG